jgi:hypothetical protein
MDQDPRYWFRAKRIGWGWGLPLTWQGWIALAVYIGVVIAGVVRFRPHEDTAAFVAVVVLASLAFALVCWWKGEPPRWRWGKD